MSLDIRSRVDQLVQQGHGKIAIGFGGNPKDKSAVHGEPALLKDSDYLSSKALSIMSPPNTRFHLPESGWQFNFY